MRATLTLAILGAMTALALTIVVSHAATFVSPDAPPAHRHAHAEARAMAQARLAYYDAVDSGCTHWRPAFDHGGHYLGDRPIDVCR